MHAIAFRWLCLVICLSWLAGCSRAPVKKREEAMRPASAPELYDDLDLGPLVAAVKSQIAVLRATSASSGKMVFGPRSMRRDEYAAGLEAFVRLAESIPERGRFLDAVREQFDFYEVYGGESWGEILVTSYFEPEVPGSPIRTDRFSQPLLRAPADIIEVAVSKYDEKFADLSPMRGRLVAAGFPPGKLQLVPYYTREEIDGGGALSKRGLEIVWVDPIDAFFIQVQGSGTVVLENGARVRVGYAEQNGHRYESIGKFMTDVLPRDKITLHTIEAYLRSVPWDRARQYLNRNPSYVFFREREGPATTHFGTAAVPGRTVATDPRFFPKGTLAFLQVEKPVWPDDKALDPVGWEKASRFVVDDDTGGAIRGTGRLDLFWGAGSEARRNAGVIKRPGRLYYLVPKMAAAPK